MKKVAIIYCSYDGIVNCYCGVGTVTQSFIYSFGAVRKFFLKNNFDISLHLITPALVPSSLGYNAEIKNNSIKTTTGSKGSVNFVTNASNGMLPYGEPHNWEAISNTCATKILEISQKYDETVVYCVDTPFMMAAEYANLQKNAYSIKNIKFVITLHSDVLIHEPDNPSPMRLAWESNAIKKALSRQNTFFASTSLFLEKHLTKTCKIPKNRFINLQTGLYPKAKRYQIISEEDVIRGLKKYQIPLDKDLVFSVGRAVPYKGFDLLINAIAKCKKRPHLVLIASPYKTEDSNVKALRKLIAKTKISVTPIFKLDFDLPKQICQWKKTKIVAQLSQYEPFGLVPEEVRLWSQKTGPVILASNRDGYKEQITDGIDGFLVDIKSIKSIAIKIDKILSIQQTKIEDIKKLGYKRAMKNYDYRLSVFKSLNQLLTGNMINVNEFNKTI